jgi:hypothetical protein
MRLLEQWNSYSQAVMPRDASAVQIQECRRAFYAGAQALMGVLDVAATRHRRRSNRRWLRRAYWSSRRSAARRSRPRFWIRIDGELLAPDEADAFAVRDGFVDAQAMKSHWEKHNDLREGRTCYGDLIHWKFPFEVSNGSN